MLRFLFAVVAYAVIAFPFASTATAQTSEAPLGVHPQGSQAHWYDGDCCNLTDCARIHVRIVDDHYVWESWRFPGYTVRVPIDKEAAAAQGVIIRISQDGDFHGCERETGVYGSGDASGTWGGVWTVTGVEPLCLYVPGDI